MSLLRLSGVTSGGVTARISGHGWLLTCLSRTTACTYTHHVLCHKYSYCRDVCDGTGVLIFLRRIVSALSLSLGHDVPSVRGQCPSRSPCHRTMPLEKGENTRRNVICLVNRLIHNFGE